MLIFSIQLKLLEILVFVLCLSSTVRSLKKSDCRCKLGARRRIVGGKLSGFVPWQVALFSSGSFTCSGFILNEYHVVSASHCTSNGGTSSLKVVVGVISLKEIDAELIYDVEKQWKNPDFNEGSLEKGHDITILKLKKPIKFKVNRIEPACIKYQDALLKDPIMIAGFGATSPVYVKNGLRSSYIPSNDLKYAHFKEFKTIYSKQIIYVRSINASESTCSGDSGSPVSIIQNGRSYVIGHNSFGETKTRNGTRMFCYGTSGFCRLSFERSFIEKYVNKKDYCLI